jgi:hypothetical protein
MRRKVFLFPLILFWLGVHAHAQLWSGVLSPSRAVDWSQAGVVGGIPTRTTICATLGTAGQSPTFVQSVTAAQISTALQSCTSGQVVFLNAGTYNLTTGVTFGGQSNITLRGAGADQTILSFSSTGSCGLLADICISNDMTDRDHVSNSANWTGTTEGGFGVYPKGASHITLSSTSNLAVGGLIYLDQLNDASDGWPSAGDIFVCNTTTCTGQGGGNSSRPNRSQIQVAEVTGISGNTVTISPGLTMPNWRSSQTPQAWWPNSANVLHDDGIEDLTASASANTHCSTCANIVLFNVRNSWVKGVRSIEANTTGGLPVAAHIWNNLVKGVTISNSYFYGSDDSSQSYGIEFFGGATSVLIQNNIFQHVTAPVVEQGAATGNVIAYNFAVDDNYTAAGTAPGWMQPMAVWHEAGEDMELYEGNSGLGTQADNIHGTHQFGTLFRNRWYGDIWNNPTKNSNTEVIHLWRYGRFFNAIGNVLGRSGYYTNYQTGDSLSIFSINGDPDPACTSGCVADPRTAATLMRWGNYDTVTGTSHFVSSEVPSGITSFANPVPATNSLPASFYLSSKPSWFGSVPWPAIGPDVAGGNGPGGHSYMIPAESCWYNVMNGVLGSSGALRFNANTCYASSGSTGGLNAPSGLIAIVQ